MVRHSTGAWSRRRCGEQGFTLLEMTVSLGILAIMAGAIAAAFSVGLHVIASGGPQDRLAGAHDLSSLEQVLGRDGSRAACVEIPGAVYGRASCTSAFNVTGCSAATSLCFAWPQFDAAWSCHVAQYSGGVTHPITRKEFSSGSPVSVIQETADNVTVRIGPHDAQRVDDGTSPAYTWLRSLQITIEARGTSKDSNSQPLFSQALTLHPVATDPGGIAGSGPC